jgi:hypothetical protein
MKAAASNGMLPLHAAVRTTNLAVVKLVYELYPDAIRKRDKSLRVPLHYCISSIPAKEWATVTPTSPIADLLRFLIKHYPKAALMFDFFNVSAVKTIGGSTNGTYFKRLMVVSFPLNRKRVHWNYKERRGAMYLLYASDVISTEIKHAREGLLIWHLLRERGSRELHQAVMSFL